MAGHRRWEWAGGQAGNGEGRGHCLGKGQRQECAGRVPREEPPDLAEPGRPEQREQPAAAGHGPVESSWLPAQTAPRHAALGGVLRSLGAWPLSCQPGPELGGTEGTGQPCPGALGLPSPCQALPIHPRGKLGAVTS